MTDIQRIRLDEITRHFEALEDPRSSVNRQHPLLSVVVIALLAVLAGANGPTAIAHGALLKNCFLKQLSKNPPPVFALGVTSAAGIAADVPGGVHLGKIG